VLTASSGIARNVWSSAPGQDPFPVLPMNDGATRSLQEIADRCGALGLVPVNVKVSDIVWRTGVRGKRDRLPING